MFAPRWTVWRLTRYIRQRLSSDEELTDLWVEGEVSEVSSSARGHLYFTLQDEQAKLRCVRWGGAQGESYRPREGAQVVVQGSITVYERGGQYQLNVQQMTPLGEGERALALARLKERLAREGLFDEARKRPLPPFPRHIALVTSSRGAAITDLTQVLGRRWPLARLTLVPSRVQGEAAVPELVTALRRADGLGADLLIVGRGGGSPDDLWAFNTEAVVRALSECRTPLISAVGHESDVTLADLVADLRAPTPSAAAELAVPESAEVLERLSALQRRLRVLTGRRLEQDRQGLEQLELRLAQSHPRSRLGLLGERLEGLQGRLRGCGLALVSRRRERLATLAAALEALSPLQVLGRGYALVKDQEGRPRGRAAAFNSGDELELTLQDGRLDCCVKRVNLNKEGAPGGADHGPAAT